MSNVRRVLIVQHGEKLNGPGDPALTDRGRRQALAVAGRLARLRPDVVFSSPLARALQTAQPIAARCRCAAGVAVDERLRERMNWAGPGSGQSLAEFAGEWARSSRDRAYVPLFGDSSESAALRMDEMLREVLRRPGRRSPMVLVSHGGVTSDFLRQHFGDRLVEKLAPGVIEQGMPAAGVTELTFDGTMFGVVRIADVSHLPEHERTGHSPA